MIGFTLFAILVGSILGHFLIAGNMTMTVNGEENMFMGFIIGAILTSIIMVFYLPITYLSANKQVISLSGSKEASREEYPELYNIVEGLVIVARVPMPKIFIVNDPAPNAFATGLKPEKAGVSVTTGLLDTLKRDELEGVIAHELAHIRNYDIRLLTMTIAMVGFIVLISNIGSRMLIYGGGRGRSSNNSKGGGGQIVMLIVGIVALIMAPLAAQVIKLAVSRNREYLADATAVEFTRNPVGLQNALRKISGSGIKVEKATQATASMYISDPMDNSKNSDSMMNKFQDYAEENAGSNASNNLKSRRKSNSKSSQRSKSNKKSKSKAGFFSTHPPIEARIERLDRMQRRNSRQKRGKAE